MVDSKRRSSAGGHEASSVKRSRKIPQHCPELTEEVRHADVPVLDQPVAADVPDDDIPVLEESLTLFEKNIPVLEETEEPFARNSDVAGDTE